MTDRELLELAAKAAGYHWPLVWPNPSPVDVPHDWNPLTDDGDAFRLAVKLKMSVSVFDDIVSIGTTNDCGYWEYPITHDPPEATRRAIVRAAADLMLRATYRDENGETNDQI